MRVKNKLRLKGGTELVPISLIIPAKREKKRVDDDAGFGRSIPSPIYVCPRDICWKEEKGKGTMSSLFQRKRNNTITFLIPHIGAETKTTTCGFLARPVGKRKKRGRLERRGMLFWVAQGF